MHANPASPSALAIQRIGWGLWLLLLFFIPWTSSPIMARLIGQTTVSPLSALPLLALVPVVILPYVLRRGRFPGIFLPLLFFILISWIASAAAMFLPLSPYKGEEVWGRILRANFTLIVGAFFYLAAIVLPTNEEKVRRSLQVIYLGLMVVLLYGTFQALLVLDIKPDVPQWIRELHRGYFVVRKIFVDRVTGFSFEPSWFADQLLMLYIPLTLSSVVRKWSAFSTRATHLSIELILGLWSTVLLVLTQSRIGFVSFGFMLAGLTLGALWVWMSRVGSSGRRGASMAWILGNRWKRVVIYFTTLVIMAAAFFALVIQISRWDDRLRRLTSIPSQMEEITRWNPNQVIYEIGDRLSLAERFVYWEAAYATFDRYPLLGVGLGNEGFLFEDTIPGYGYRLTEMADLLEAVNPNFPNPKNLWLRLLSETGVVGFAAYSAWLLIMGVGAAAVIKYGKGAYGVVGLAGGLALLAVVFEGFSIDTFGLPQSWILFGLLTNSIWIHLPVAATSRENSAG